MRHSLRAGVGAGALLAALAAAPTSAQEAQPSQDALRAQEEAQRQTDPAGNEELAPAGSSPADIIVTAQLREQALEDVPLSIQAFQGETLEKTGFRELRDIVALVPGASEGRGNAAGIRSYQIRGVSSFYGDSTIGYYLDDAAYVIPNRNYAPVVRSFDLDRVEVLRGPQGTLYGLGSMGGTMRFITADPDLTRFRVRGDLAISDTDEGGRANYYGDLALSAPIVRDRLAIRGVASYEKRGGFAQSPSFPGDWDDDTYQNYRVKLLAKLTDAVTVRASYNRNVTEDDWGQNYSLANNRAFPRSPVAGRNKQVYDFYTGYVGIDLGPVLLESSTGYVDRVDRSTGPIILGVNAPAFRLDVLGVSESFVQEVRLVSQDKSPFDWVLGAIYQDAESLEDIKVIGGPPISAVSVFDSKSWAVFGEASIGLLGDTLRPLVGLRYFRDDREFTSQNRPPRGPLPPAFNREAKFDSWNPRFNLSYMPTEQVNLYVNIAKGFRSGTFNSAAAVAAGAGGFEVAPDDLWSYEVGGKITLFGGKLFAELAAYRLDWSDIQINYTIAGGIQVIANAGDVRGTGFEYSLTWLPVTGLSVTATGNFNSTEFKRIDNPAVFRGLPSIAEGRQVASVPDTTFSLGATYTTPIGLEGADLFLNAQYSYIGKQGDAGDPLGRFGESQSLLRARAGLQWERYGLHLFGENLLGEDDAIIVSNSGQTRYYPRVIGVELSFNY